MIKDLSALGAVERVFKSETNFLMIVVRDKPRVMALLKEHKIQLLDSSTSIPHSIRVSLGTEEQNRKFLEVMGKASC